RPGERAQVAVPPADEAGRRDARRPPDPHRARRARRGHGRCGAARARRAGRTHGRPRRGLGRARRPCTSADAPAGAAAPPRLSGAAPRTGQRTVTVTDRCDGAFSGDPANFTVQRPDARTSTFAVQTPFELVRTVFTRRSPADPAGSQYSRTVAFGAGR